MNDISFAFDKVLIELALGADLGYVAGATKPEAVSNQRNGSSVKTVLTDDGALRIAVPGDRDGSFEPLLIPSASGASAALTTRSWPMYARGMTVREIKAFLVGAYGVRESPDFISSVTDAVMAGVGAWQSRPLEPMYQVVFFDALRVKIREDALVRDKAIYLALGILPDATSWACGSMGTEGASSG